MPVAAPSISLFTILTEEFAMRMPISRGFWGSAAMRNPSKRPCSTPLTVTAALLPGDATAQGDAAFEEDVLRVFAGEHFDCVAVAGGGERGGNGGICAADAHGER